MYTHINMYRYMFNPHILHLCTKNHYHHLVYYIITIYVCMYVHTTIYGTCECYVFIYNNFFSLKIELACRIETVDIISDDAKFNFFLLPWLFVVVFVCLFFSFISIFNRTAGVQFCLLWVLIFR